MATCYFSHNKPSRVSQSTCTIQNCVYNIIFQVALQDHNYCAVPPPSPPRSPTPPLSPYPINMGAQPAPSQDPQVNERQSFSFGIAGYNKSSSSPNVGAYPSPHYAGPQAPVSATPLSRLKQTIEEAGVGPMTPLGEEVII